jgi:uncharacterized protein with NRDE domain
LAADAGRGLRLACNRDESRARPPALPPEVRLAEGRQIIMPIDPVSDGTWIGASDAGLVAALLNAYPEGFAASALAPGQNPPTSRGTIIPVLLGSTSLDELVERAAAIDTSRFAPFRLVLADSHEVAEMAWTASSVELRSRDLLTAPMMFTSSGLGDELVDRPRRELFRTWFHEPVEWPAEQNAFHRHQWSDAPGVSVCMSRAEARTVSYTVVETGPRSVTLSYYPLPPNQPSAAIVASVDLK